VRGDQREPCAVRDALGTECAQPSLDALILSRAEISKQVCPQEIAGLLHVPTAARVLDGAFSVLSAAVPVCGSLVKYRLEFRVGAPELCQEHLPEQTVEAIPLMTAVDRLERHVGPSELIEYGR